MPPGTALSLRGLRDVAMNRLPIPQKFNTFNTFANFAIFAIFNPNLEYPIPVHRQASTA